MPTQCVSRTYSGGGCRPVRSSFCWSGSRLDCLFLQPAHFEFEAQVAVQVDHPLPAWEARINLIEDDPTLGQPLRNGSTGLVGVKCLVFGVQVHDDVTA